MVKLYLDANGLAPIAQALSGQSKLAGVEAGLRNQMLGAQLDEQRFKQQQAYQAQERQDSMGLSAIAQALPGFSAAQVGDVNSRFFGGKAQPQGFKYGSDGLPVMGADGVPQADDPISYTPEQQQMIQNAVKVLAPQMTAIQGMNAYGGDGLDYVKSLGVANENSYKAGLGNLVLAAAQNGNLARQNAAVAAYEGKTHSPYRVDGYGQGYNQDTGVTQQTPASTAKIGNITANTGYQQAQTGLANARTQSEAIQQITERLRQQGLTLDNQGKTIDNQGKVIKLNQSLNPQTGTAATKAPNADDARLFTSVDPLTGKPQVDYDRLNQAYLFAQQHGYASVSAALPAFGRWEQEKAYITSRSGSDRLIEEAAALSPRARAVAGNSGATLVGQTLQSKYGQRINNKQSKDAAMRELKEAVANGFISQQAAGDLWEQMTGEK